jgi:type IV pilus assembly protein PilP
MRNYLIFLLACVACTALTGCGGEQHSDLRNWVKEQDNLPRGRIPQLPEVKPYQAIEYAAFDLTDPFKPRKIEAPKNVGQNSGIQPDPNRRREPLEAYPLEALKMVGVLKQKGIFGLVKTPDNTLFQVKAGSYLGQNFGRITAVSESSIKLKELVQDSNGNWEEKEQTLLLQE